MKYGVVFPQVEFPSDPAAIKDYAQTAEELGYNHLLAYDHVLGANPDREGGWSGSYAYTDPFQEPLILFSYLTGFTESLEFISGIIILPQRQTALIAKQAATLDVLCNGRLRLGVALGWNEVEYVCLNQDFSTRADRFEEQIELLRQLWTEELVVFEGKYHTIPDAGINPLPVQRPIPLWFGGHADPVIRRIAKMADGWLPNYRTPEDGAEALEKLEQYLAEAGRTMADIGLEARVRIRHGDEDLWASVAESWEAAGATHLTVNTMGAGIDTPQGHIEALQQFAKLMNI